MTTSLGRKATLAVSHREKQRPRSPKKTGLVTLGPSRTWHREAGPPEGLAKGQEAQVGDPGREAPALQEDAEQSSWELGSQAKEGRTQSRVFCVAEVWLLVACNFLAQQCGKIPQGRHARASYVRLST